MKLNSLFLVLITTFLLVCFTVSAQQQPAPQQPPAPEPGYFLFPIKPGTQNWLSGSMGELRPNHFHGGIDIKTEGRTGLPVYASADGYVSRVKSSTYGYGNIIYLTHPNGYVTTYAHLESFAEPLGEYMLRKQYEKQVFELELHLPKDQIVFKRGDIIGMSGNTGGSGGPHLHFEIRDKDDNLINPLKFGFAEIKDQIPPDIFAFALRTLSIDGRVNNQFGRFEFSPKKNGTTYTIPDTLQAYGLLGLELLAIDRLDGAANKNGVQRVDVSVNQQPVYTHVIDNIPFEKNRMIACHINYENLKLTGNNYQKCYLSDGNTLPLYTTNARKGKIKVQDGELYEVVAEVSDSYKNVSVLRFFLKGVKPVYTKTLAGNIKIPALDYKLAENILHISGTDTGSFTHNVTVYKGNVKFDVVPSYTINSVSAYLYDIRAGMPDSMSFGGMSRKFSFQQVILPGSETTLTNKYMKVTFPEGSLYDTLYLQTGYSYDVYSVQDPLTPLFRPIRIKLEPQKDIADKARTSVYYAGWGKSRGYAGGTWQGNSIAFNTINLGKFRILTDVTPPKVTLLSKSPVQIRLKISDDLSGLASFRAELNGEFLLMKFEHKTATIYSEKLDKTVPLRGDFELKVKDAVGNETVYKTKI